MTPVSTMPSAAQRRLAVRGSESRSTGPTSRAGDPATIFFVWFVLMVLAASTRCSSATAGPSSRNGWTPDASARATDVLQHRASVRERGHPAQGRRHAGRLQRVDERRQRRADGRPGTHQRAVPDHRRRVLQRRWGNAPAGLPGIAGTSSVVADADAALDPYVDAVAEVEDAGGRAGTIYVSPTTWAA